VGDVFYSLSLLSVKLLFRSVFFPEGNRLFLLEKPDAPSSFLIPPCVEQRLPVSRPLLPMSPRDDNLPSSSHSLREGRCFFLPPFLPWRARRSNLKILSSFADFSSWASVPPVSFSWSQARFPPETQRIRRRGIIPSTTTPPCLPFFSPRPRLREPALLPRRRS